MASYQNEEKSFKGLKKMGRVRFIPPMLATLTEDYFSDPDWIFEEKFDGMRCIAIKKKGKIELYSRNKKKINAAFPELVLAMQKQKSKDYIVDGEIITLDRQGVSHFSALQKRMHVLDTSRVKGGLPKVYLALFDILCWDGYDLRQLPLIQRKKILAHLFPFTRQIYDTPHVKEKGLSLYKKAAQKGWEGIIAKKADSPYLSKRSRNWLKFKCNKSQEFVICGYTSPQGERRGFGALLIGYYKRGILHFAGKVGTGYSRRLLEELSKRLTQLEIKKSPFREPIKERKIHWVKPRLVCEVVFTEWTKEGKLRHPRFTGLRSDKSAKEVTRE